MKCFLNKVARSRYLGVQFYLRIRGDRKHEPIQ
jgi:hypothetical protein